MDDQKAYEAANNWKIRDEQNNSWNEKDFAQQAGKQAAVLGGIAGLGAYQGNLSIVKDMLPYAGDREFLVTATLQIAVRASNAIEAQIDIKEVLEEIIATSDFYADPLNGAVIVRVEDL